MAISGAKASTVHRMISWGVFVSNCAESAPTSLFFSMTENYTRYNHGMDLIVAKQLRDLNRRFYTDYGRDFSATRGRLQTGVLRVIESLHGDELILDLGSGNGELARALSRRGHHGSYLGLDFSLPLLGEAGREAFALPVQFMQVDLVSNDWDVIASDGRVAAKQRTLAPGASAGVEIERSNPLFDNEIATPPLAARNDKYDIVFAFAVLHHIPSVELRLQIIQKISRTIKT